MPATEREKPPEKATRCDSSDRTSWERRHDSDGEKGSAVFGGLGGRRGRASRQSGRSWNPDHFV